MSGEKRKVRVRFLPDGKEAEAKEGDILLGLALSAGIRISAPCGGTGKCGKCKVIVSNENGVEAEYERSREDVGKKLYLACRTHVKDMDLDVVVPKESLLSKHQTLTEGILREIKSINPFVKKTVLKLKGPSHEDESSNLSDLERVKKELNLVVGRVPLDVLRRLPSALREKNGLLTLALSDDGQVVDVEAGDTSRKSLGLAVDIGTTTIVAYLVDLNDGRVVSMRSSYNSQISFGGDVQSRMLYAEEHKKEDGLRILQDAVVDTINGLILELAEENKFLPEDIICGVFSGNTVMTHLFLGLDPLYLRTEPYVPTINTVPYFNGGNLGLKINKNALVYCVPCIGSYVGGDIVSDILVSRMHESQKMSMLIDVGTNGEIVLGGREWLIACSCSAGPAFEGAEVKYGMAATQGAIERIWINPQNLEPSYSTIGGVKPKGVCGSGLIDLTAELFLNKVIDRAGNVDLSLKNKRVRKNSDGIPEYVFAWVRESSINEDLSINEADIKSIIHTKAAIYAGFSTLIKSMGFSFSDIERFYVAGGFGNYIDVSKAIVLGLLPDVPTEKFTVIGNGSVAGARLALISGKMKAEAEEIAKKTTYFELSASPIFTDEYMSSMFLPHTNIDLFPTVKELVGKQDEV